MRRPQPSGLQTSAPTPWSSGERHQLPLVVAADERVVDLVADVPRPAVALGDGERLHEVPAGEVGAGDVANLAFADHLVEGVEGLFDGRGGVEGVQVVDVDVVGVEALEGAFERGGEVVARAADVVRALAGAEGGLGGEEDVLALEVGDGFAEDVFALAVGVDIGGVEEIAAGLHADVDEVLCLFVLHDAPGFEEVVRAVAEGAGAEGRVQGL